MERTYTGSDRVVYVGPRDEEEPFDVGPLRPVRSDEVIDPNECNQIHNISACRDDDFGGKP